MAADKNSRTLDTARIVIGGGYDARVKDNLDTLDELVSLTESLNLSYSLITSLGSPLLEEIKLKSKSPSQADILFLPNFTTAQRTRFSNHHTPLLSSIHSTTSTLHRIGGKDGVRVAHHRMQFRRTKHRQTSELTGRLASFSTGLSLVQRDEGNYSSDIDGADCPHKPRETEGKRELYARKDDGWVGSWYQAGN